MRIEKLTGAVAILYCSIWLIFGGDGNGDEYG